MTFQEMWMSINVRQPSVLLELGALTRMAATPGAFTVSPNFAVTPAIAPETSPAPKDESLDRYVDYVRSDRKILFGELRKIDSIKNIMARPGSFQITHPLIPPAIIKLMEQDDLIYFAWRSDGLMDALRVYLSKFEGRGLAMSREERLFVRGLARHAGVKGVGSILLYSILRALNDFDSLYHFAKSVKRNDDCRFKALAVLEEFEELFASEARKNLKNFSISMGDSKPSPFDGLQTLVNLLVAEKAEQCHTRESKVLRKFSVSQTAAAISSLSPSYDVCVALARGGLFAGTVAELLGHKVITLQVAAHDQKNPWSRFIGEVHPEDIRGKRVLLLEDDTVSGASIKEAVKALKPFGPVSMGVFFNHGYEYFDGKGLEITRSLGLAVHHSENMTYEPSLPFFYRLHEALNTSLGRLRKVNRAFEEVLDACTRSDVASTLKTYTDEQERLYFALNHFLPGMEKVREAIVHNLESSLGQYKEAHQLASMFPSSLDSIASLITSKSLMPLGWAEHLAKGRYQEKAEKRVAELKVSGIRFPHSYTAAFRAAKAAQKDSYDVALIVGPEGFSFEPIFQDLGIPTVAINIPEDSFGGARTMKAFDDLAALKGKKVLVVEDDVQSGATLKKILEAAASHAPRSWGLYLGLASQYQKKDNIPPVFQKVYVADTDEAKDEAAFLAHLKKHEPLFKRKFTPSVPRRTSHK